MSSAPASRDVVRAGCGAALFGVPLLYTMELWWSGTSLSPATGVVVVLGVLGAAIVIDRTAGFRFHDDRAWGSSAIDGVEVVAVCVVLGAVMLVVLGEIDGGTHLRESLSKVVAQLVPLVLGGSIANEIFGDAGSSGDADDQADAGASSAVTLPVTLRGVVGGAVLGSVVVALAIAPTDEVIIIAGRSTVWHLLALTVASLVASHAIVFSADFGRRRPRSAVRVELAHSGIAYGAAITTSAAMLAFYGRLDGVSMGTSWSRVIALGFPAAIGAAAGRLAV